MEMRELLEFVAQQDEKLRGSGMNTGTTLRESVLARMVKLTEEVGELADEVLSSQGDQRQEKLAEKSDDALGNEVADVIITVLLLAAALKVDVPGALMKKMEKIRTRVYDRGR